MVTPNSWFILHLYFMARMSWLREDPKSQKYTQWPRMLPLPLTVHHQGSYNYCRRSLYAFIFHCCLSGGAFQKIINKRSVAINNMIESKWATNKKCSRNFITSHWILVRWKRFLSTAKNLTTITEGINTMAGQPNPPERTPPEKKRPF